MVEIADANLPVFPFRVNWRRGISEHLEWKTDILSDFLGNEQRRSLRLTPRRSFEVTLSLWAEDRQFWDLWLHRLGGNECLFPLWHDSIQSSQPVAQGQKVILVDTRGLEFKIGSYGLLRGLTAMSSERFQIAEVHDDRIITAANIAVTWKKGTRVEPLVRGRLEDSTKAKIISSRVSESQVALECTREQPYALGVDTWDQYAGMPVLTSPPNRSETLDMTYAWNFSESDNTSGRRFRKTENNRAEVRQKHEWALHGRAAKQAFRQLLYRLRGSAKPLWLPTFNDDLTLSKNNPEGTTLYVKACGWAYTGGASSGRDHVMINLQDGTRLFRKIIGTVASGLLSEERLVLDAPIPALLMAGVRSISFMDTARLDNDQTEFDHVNAADGASRVSSLFKTFRNERVSPAIISLDIPVSIMTGNT